MSKTITNDQKREWAQILYTKERLPQKEIATKVGVSEKTITAWKERYNWDNLRQSLLVTKEEQIRRLYIIVDKLTSRIEEDEHQGDTKEADKLVKYTAAINALETETSLSEIIDVGQKFISFLRIDSLDFAKEVAKYYDAFIQHNIK